MDFYEIVNSHLAELTRNERVLFDYVISNLNVIKNKSIREVSEECFVSTTTFLRFVRKIGFSGYSEFSTVIKYTLLTKNDVPQQSPFVVSQRDYREEYLKNLIESVRVMDSDKIKKIVLAMQEKPKIFFIRQRNEQRNYGLYQISLYYSWIFCHLSRRSTNKNNCFTTS